MFGRKFRQNLKDMINKVILIGNVGADPEIRTLETGIKVATIRMATTERMYNRESQETKEHTEWHRVTLWRNLADVADRFVRTGSQIYIEGRLRSREWTDNQGVKRYSIEIVADDMKMLGRKPDGGSPAPLSGHGGGYQGGAQGGNQGGYNGGSQGQQGGGYQSGEQNGGFQNPQSGSHNGYQQSPQHGNPPQPSAPEPPIQDDPDDLPF